MGGSIDGLLDPEFIVMPFAISRGIAHWAQPMRPVPTPWMAIRDLPDLTIRKHGSPHCGVYHGRRGHTTRSRTTSGSTSARASSVSCVGRGGRMARRRTLMVGPRKIHPEPPHAPAPHVRAPHVPDPVPKLTIQGRQAGQRSGRLPSARRPSRPGARSAR